MQLSTSATKGNSGLSAQRRKRQKLLIWGGSMLVVTFCVKTVVHGSRFAGVFLVGESTGGVDDRGATGRRSDNGIRRRRPERHHHHHHHPQHRPDQQSNNEMDAILEGEYTLIDINIPSSALLRQRRRGDGGRRDYNQYEGVTATFCSVDWTLQQRNPSEVPMFRDLQTKSASCDATTIVVDLYEVVQESKKYDAKFGITSSSFQSSSSSSTLRQKQQQQRLEAASVLSVAPTGVVFHETRCGSTLMANLLASFDPETVRVYSESPPPVSALRACDSYGVGGGGECHPERHRQLIRDVFYMMGRRPINNKSRSSSSSSSKIQQLQQQQQQEYHVFYKIQSIGVMNVDKFTSAFPTTPWVFMYRDTVEVMQSHWGKIPPPPPPPNFGRKRTQQQQQQRPVCARNFGNRRQPPTTMQVIQKVKGNGGGTATSVRDVMDDMGPIEYCAAHLAGLSLSAIQEHERRSENNPTTTPIMSRFVNYASMPSVVWEDLLPNHFGIAVSNLNIQNMEQAASVYSKGRGPKANQEWVEDSTKKQDTAIPEVVRASKLYVGDIYEKMERLAKQGMGREAMQK